MRSVLCGDVLAMLATVPDNSVDCCVTSPPYWGLRDYGHGGQIGLEKTPQEFVAKMVEVFREVRRVLKPEGTCWVNLGSSYASGGTQTNLARPPQSAPAYGIGGTEPQDSQATGSACLDLCDECLSDFRNRHAGNGCSNPTRSQVEPPSAQKGHDSAPQGSDSATPVASRLGALESTTPESSPLPPASCWRCGTRPVSASLKVSLTSCGCAPASAGTAPCNGGTSRIASGHHNQGKDASGTAWVNYTPRYNPKDLVPIPWLVALALQEDGWILRQDIIWAKPNPMPESVTDRCTKSHEYVFLLTKSPRYFYDAAEVAEQAIGGDKGAGTRNYRPGTDGNQRKDEGQTVLENRGLRNKRSVWTIGTQPYPGAHFATFPEELARTCILAGCPLGGVVLDPFSGSGTTLAVALANGRDYLGIELNPAYIPLIESRLMAVTPPLDLFAEAA